MEINFQVQTKIQKPVAEVFDAVYSPEKLSGYFTNGGAKGTLDEGATVEWAFEDTPGEEMRFEPDGGSTIVRITESGWDENDADLQRSYANCMGWSQMVSALKAYVEYGINLRKGAYDGLFKKADHETDKTS